MPIESILVLLAVAVLASLALVGASPGTLGDRVRRIGRAGESPSRRVVDTSATSPATSTSRGPGDDQAVRSDDTGRGMGLRPAALDRVIRVATWVFLFAATTIVAVTDLWDDLQGPILLVLAAAGVYTVVVHELVLRRVPVALLLMVEGGLSVLVAGVLVALTGGATSPFFFTLPLIVVGAATVVTPGVTLALTAGAAAAYLAAILVATVIDPGADAGAAGLATAGVNLTALFLIAYVGMAIGREQRRAREDANRLATLDPLTGLRNRGALFAALERELARSQRTGRSFCLLMIDLDDLKVINDRHGHLVGDRALRLLGEVIRAGIRRIDTGARFGGDEFVVLLPETDPTGGWVLAEKVRLGVADAGLVAGGSPVATSVSVGLVTYPQDGETVGELLERADEAMYRSKRGGRDRVTGVPVMDDGSARSTPSTGGRGKPV